MRGKGDDGFGEAETCEKPPHDSDGLLIAGAPLAVDQDDAVHVMVGFLKSGESYVLPYLPQFLHMLEEELRRDFVLH